jgi:uncharacterized protein (DUF1778 family)
MHTNHTESQKTERIDIRIDLKTKQRIEKAAAIDHRSITSFIISRAIESADEILQRGDQMILSDKDWDKFHIALTKPQKPNQALKKAAAKYKSLNIKSDV